MPKNQQGRVVRRKVKKKKNKKRILLVLIPVLIVFLSAAGYGGYLYFKADQVLSESYVEDTRDRSPLRDAEIDPSIDNVSMLIMGVDANEHRDNEESSLTDALMVATFNKDENSIKLLSIPRDSLVYIPEVGYEDKINHAHAFGGPSATIETVENLLDIPIDYYVRLNFHAFVDVIDALGGVEVDVPYEFTESNSMDQRDSIHLYEGRQTIDGEEALALARTRKLDNDIERGKRQQEIVEAVLHKATSFSSILRYDELLQAVGDNMTTNMSFSDMRTFISYAIDGENLEMESATLEGTDYQPANVYYWSVDQAGLQEKITTLQEHLDLIPSTEEETIPAHGEPHHDQGHEPHHNETPPNEELEHDSHHHGGEESWEQESPGY